MNFRSAELIGKNRVPIYERKQQQLTTILPSDIPNRLPNVIFTGPANLYNQRVGRTNFSQEVGIGRVSSLKTLDMSFLTRDVGTAQMKRKNDLPGEIGWNATYFADHYQFANSNKRADSNYVPR